MSLKATVRSSYIKKDVGRIWVYGVSGTPKEIAAYVAAKGDFNVNDEAGMPLFFLTERDGAGAMRLIKPQIKLLITTNNRVVIDDQTEIVALHAHVELLLADKIAGHMADAMFKPATPTVRPAVAATPKQLQSAEDLLNDATNQTAGEGANVNELVGAEVGEGAGSIAD